MIVSMIERTTAATLPAHLPFLRLLYAAFLKEWKGEYPRHPATDVDRFTQLVAQAVVDPDRIAADQFYLAVAPGKLGTPIGFLAGEIQTRALGTPTIFCAAHWLYVLPQYRGRGVARALVLHALEWLAHHPEAAHVELLSEHGDPQWAARGWLPALTTYVTPVAAVRTQLTGNGHIPDMEVPDATGA